MPVLERPVRALLVILGFALLSAAPARADVYDDNPTAASRGPGDMVVLARGTDGTIHERHLAGGSWTPWASIGLQASSGPAAVAYGGDIHVFALGPDNAIYQNVLSGSGWSGWASLGGYGTSAPAATARNGTNYLDLAVRGGDNAIWHRTYIPGTGWSDYSLGGNLTSAPALNSQDPGVLNVWARGTDGQLVARAWNGTAWRDWEALGGGILGAPAVISRMANHIDVFARGTNRGLYQRWWSGPTSWSQWGLLDPASLDSSPAAASDRPDHLVLFARRGAGLSIKEWTYPTWTAWSDWGPVAPPPAPAPAPPPPPQDGSVGLAVGDRCTPPGGRLRVSLKVRKRAGRARPRVHHVVFFVKRGPRSVDRKRPYVRRLRINRPAGARGRVYARAFFTRKGSKQLRRKTVSKRFVVCS